LRPLERLAVLASQDARLRLAEPVAGVEQEIDLAPVAPRELVQRPGRHRRLPEPGQGGRAFRVAFLLELLRQPRPLGDDGVEVGAVDLVERVVQRHPTYVTPPTSPPLPAPPSTFPSGRGCRASWPAPGARSWRARRASSASRCARGLRGSAAAPP